jgi:dUTP pyrophosphatase
MRIPIKLSCKTAKIPTKAHSTDAGFDLYTPIGFSLGPSEITVVNLGIHLAIPEGWYGQVACRSSLARSGITTLGGVVDSGYTGPVHVVLVNLSHEAKCFNEGDRIAQLILLPVVQANLELVSELEQTARGERGFGSTGK